MKRANFFDIKSYILNNVTMSFIFAFYNGFHCIIDKQDVFVKHNAPDNGQFQRRPRSQGQIF